MGSGVSEEMHRYMLGVVVGFGLIVLGLVLSWDEVRTVGLAVRGLGNVVVCVTIVSLIWVAGTGKEWRNTLHRHENRPGKADDSLRKKK